MNVSSRTPEGEPLSCEICGTVNAVEVSSAGDALCPQCGSLLWEFRGLVGEAAGVPVDELSIDRLEQIAADSLDLVELTIALEDMWGETLAGRSIDEAESLRELLRWIRQNRREGGDAGPTE